MQAAFPHMRERGGRIINFASWYGVTGNAGTVGYNITKEAIRGLTRTPGSGLATGDTVDGRALGGFRRLGIPGRDRRRWPPTIRGSDGCHRTRASDSRD